MLVRRIFFPSPTDKLMHEHKIEQAQNGKKIDNKTESIKVRVLPVS
jgi:hypothetical protein